MLYSKIKDIKLTTKKTVLSIARTLVINNGKKNNITKNVIFWGLNGNKVISKLLTPKKTIKNKKTYLTPLIIIEKSDFFLTEIIAYLFITLIKYKR